MKKVLLIVAFITGLVTLSVAVKEGYGVERTRFEPRQTGSMRSGDVTIELRPELKEGNLIVKFAANTHTENLSGFDLAESAVLEYAGKRVSPSRADRLRGHHAFGKMEFEVAGPLRDFRIVITGIPAAQERVFTWGNP
jgi:uncharacterized protein (DUF58 family)